MYNTISYSKNLTHIKNNLFLSGVDTVTPYILNRNRIKWIITCDVED